MTKIRGSVSLFAAMIFLIVASVITTSITSARVAGARVMVNTALAMAADSVFSKYNAALFSKFGVLLLDGKDDTLCNDVSNYYDYNIDTNKDLILSGNTDIYGIIQKGISVNNQYYATDCGGLLWFDMAADYEKYAKPVKLAADYLDIGSASAEAEVVEEISDEIMECTERVVDIADGAKRLTEIIDGVKCPDKGIDFDRIKTTDKFVKKYCPYEINMENLEISNKDVFSAVEEKIEKPYEMLDDCISYFKDKRITKAEHELDDVRKISEETKDTIEDALSEINEIRDNLKEFKNSVNSLDTLVDENRNKLSKTTIEGVEDEIDELKTYDTVIATDICDVNRIAATFKINKSYLGVLIDAIDKIDMSDVEDEVVPALTELQDILKGYSLKGTKINYDKLGKSEEDKSEVDSLSEFLETGILSLVVPEGTEISSSETDVTGLASTVCDTSNTKQQEENMEALTLTGKKVLYNEYVIDHFNSYTDKKEGAAYNYEIEYVLYGNNSDTDNLFEAVTKIAAIRSGVNMLYLLTDSGKKAEAYGLAATMIGFTGIEPLIRLLQFTIMYLWSYAEGLADVKILLNGKKIGVAKTAEDWQLSFENLLAHNISAGDGKKNGLDYETFLRFLLYIEDDGEKSANTMDLVELSMIKSGDKEFRLSNYIYGAELEAAYELKGIDNSYSEKTSYTY